MGKTYHHMAMDIRGAIINRAFNGFTHPDGRKMTRREAENALLDELAKGRKLIPMGECEGFSYETGCPGHPMEELDGGTA